MAKPGSKKQSGKKIEILICGHICCITLHFTKKHMKNMPVKTITNKHFLYFPFLHLYTQNFPPFL